MEDDKEEFNDDLFHRNDGKPRSKKKSNVRRTAGKLADLAGGQDMAYVEQNRSRNKDLKKNKGESNAFFKKLARENAKKKLAE
ncbi:hypothetical protein EYC84_011514 [Monilinia fructicola]|nr:hypothetical protein EYC84_011514 [Monilinia fructicola]